MPEIDDATFAHFSELKKLIGEMESNPEARPHLEKAVKSVRPNVRTESDVAESYAAPVKAELAATRKELEELKTSLAEEKRAEREKRDQDALHNAFAKLRSDRGYTDEGVKDVAQLMLDRGIGDVNAAALLYENLNPKPPEVAPSSYEPRHWKVAPEEDMARIFTDENGWEADKISEALRDVRSGAVH